MTQKEHREQCSFLLRCEEAYDLVQDFLNDSSPHGAISPRAKGYTYRPQRRQVVKEKVKKSLEVLESFIERHKYVLLMSEFSNDSNYSALRK